MVEAGLDGEGRLGAGGAGDDLGQPLGGIVGARGVEDHGVVGLASSGQGDVGVVAAGGRFEDGDADVDGGALGAVAGDRPAQLDVAGDVVGGQDDLAAFVVAGDEAAFGVGGGDGPGLAVADRVAAVGAQRWVVATGGDLVADVGRGVGMQLMPPVAFGFSSRWISRFTARAVSAVLVVIATVRPPARWPWCALATWEATRAGWAVWSRPCSA